MINRQYILKVQYSPKTAYDNQTLGDKTLTRVIKRALESQGIYIDNIQAVEFVDPNDLRDLDELFNPDNSSPEE